MFLPYKIRNTTVKNSMSPLNYRDHPGGSNPTAPASDISGGARSRGGGGGRDDDDDNVSGMSAGAVSSSASGFRNPPFSETGRSASSNTNFQVGH